MCPCVVSVVMWSSLVCCEVVAVPYVDVVVAVTVMRVLLFVLRVCMLREYECWTCVCVWVAVVWVV